MSIEAKEKKAKIVEDLKEELVRCNVAILTDYRGLNTVEMTQLRRKLQESGIKYRVVKNTLARFAAQKAGMDDLANAFVGPMAIALGYDDEVTPAKILAGYIRTIKENLSIKGGVLGDRLLTAEEVMTLSTLPAKEILIAKLLGQMISPISAMVGCLTNPMRGMVGVLQARIRQLEGENNVG